MEKTQQTRNKAKDKTRSSKNKQENPSDIITPNEEDKMLKNEGNTDQERDKDLLEKMSVMMKGSLNKAVLDIKELIASEISSLALINKEDITKLKKETSTKFKALEDKMVAQKKTTDKIPQMEKTVSKVKEVLTEEVCVNLKNFADTAPKINQIETKAENLQEGYDELTKSLEYANEDISQNKADIESLKAMLKAQQKSINKLISSNRKTQKKLGDLSEFVNTLDNRQRKFNLVFEGVGEEDKQNTKEIITKLITEANIGSNTAMIDSAYRLGRKVGKRKRPILVSFSNLAEKDLILTKASDIKKHANNTELWINKDLSEVSRIKSMEVRKCYNMMRKQKLKCKLTGAIIEYNHKSYEHKDLDLLPKGCRLEDAHIIPCDNVNLCFAGSHAYLSNFYSTEFEYEENHFTSSEQAFQWKKATFNNDNIAAEKILDVDDPYTIKKLGADVKTSQNWDNDEEQILHDIVREKFLQNKTILERFISTPHTAFFECTVGNKWGCGSKLNYIDLDPEKLKGINRFGVILNALKTELIEENQKERPK